MKTKLLISTIAVFLLCITPLSSQQTMAAGASFDCVYNGDTVICPSTPSFGDIIMVVGKTKKVLGACSLAVIYDVFTTAGNTRSGQVSFHYFSTNPNILCLAGDTADFIAGNAD